MHLRIVLFGILVCLAWTPASTVLTAEKEADSPWRGTGLDLSFVQQRLKTQACTRTDRAYLSCVGLIQGVLDSNGQDLHLVPVSDDADLSLSPKVVAEFGAALVIEDRALRIGGDSSAFEVIRARGQRIVRWEDRLRADGRQGVDFTAIRTWLEAEVMDPARSEDFAAAAINGYLQVADAHARIAPAGPMGRDPRGQPANGTSRRTNELAYTGIGAGVQTMLDAALVTSILWKGPASSAGLQVHDFILAVDGESVTGLTTEAVVERLRGPSGKQVTLTVKRESKTLTIPIVRQAVTVRNVISSVLVDRGWQFLYLRIYGFLRGDTCSAVRRELRKRLKPNLNGLILDLRDNAGGLIDQAVCVADFLLPEEEIVLTVRGVRDTERARQIRTRQEARVRLPTVTLVNAGTASASEVLAGALQDHGRSLVVGERTFGKGTVQTARPWRGSSSILEFYTVARYYRPNGVGVQLVGIEPDIPVAETPSDARQERVVLREGDLFPTALPEEREQWTQPDPGLVATVQECLSEDGLANHRLRRNERQGQRTDYPLSVGQDVLVCGLTRRL